jgi:hypothetical protein
MKLHLIIASMFAACSMYAANPIEALQQEVAELRQQLASQQQQLSALRPLAALAPFITVDLNPEEGVRGPNIVFHGANVHILAIPLPGPTYPSAAVIAEYNGLGNLIIGEDLNSEYHPPFPRTGTNNLVIGQYNGWTGTNCIVGGMDNEAAGDGNLVLGYWNKINAYRSAILGGVSNDLTDSFNADTVIGGTGLSEGVITAGANILQ